jgi:lipopolysaccharide export system protein LptA
LKYLKLKILFFILLASSAIFSQEKVELKNADKLEGKIINGQNVREATGNVNFEQGNIKVFCNSATQYLDANKVELHGNVKIYQDTLTLFTSNAVYFGNDKTAICSGGVILKDPKATMTANGGIYYFNLAKAIFKGNVKIVNPEYVITSNELEWYRNTEDSFAKGDVKVTTDSAVMYADNIDFYKSQGKTIGISNVKIISDSSVITSDTLTNFSNERKSIAKSNVKIENLKDNLQISGNYLENYEKTSYSLMKGNTKLVQIGKENDTLFIYCEQMEAFRAKPEHYIAKENVEIIRDKFLSKCGHAIFDKTDTLGHESITLMIDPVVWQDNMQMTGDSIHAALYDRKIETIYDRKLDSLKNTKKSLVLIQNLEVPDFNDRYDQISGNDITMYFKEGKISFTEVKKNSNSIYFIYENKKANGANISEGENMFIYFDSDEKVATLKIEKDPKGQYVPEILVGSAKTRLPEFVLRTDKPIKR